MKVVGKFNDVSAEIKPKPLKRGEVAMYRLLNGRLDYARRDENGKPVMTYGKSIRIPTLDRIWDPGKKEFVDIGVVHEFTNNVVTRTKAFYATPGGDYINNGIFQFSGDSNSDAEFYEFFEMSNFNKSFKHRDISVEPMFERVDTNKENEQRLNQVTSRTEALIAFSNMSVAELRDFAAQMNWDELAEPSVLKVQVGTFADSDPVNFLKILNDEQFALRALVKNALTKSVVGYDPVQHRIIWANTDQTIAKLDRVDGKNHVDIFAEWLATSSNGSAVKSSIEKKVRGVRKEEIAEKVSDEDQEEQTETPKPKGSKK